ncbi:MAG TPA: PD-(D/E)XK nuclease family protein [Phycisphaerae bacterium]|jgi:Holliday junction resolvase-like predicted endonuclease|nr:PD-(D/E)XK nuclease family protein [Phycisphaerae bacterium]
MIKSDREHWSYSQINQFLKICPLQFAFQRLFRMQPEFVTENMPFGSAIHRTAEYFWAKRVKGQDVTSDELAALFADVWQREVADTPNLRFQRGDFDSLLSQGQQLIRVYRENIPDDLDIVGFNVPFQVPLIDRQGEVLEKPLVGEIDLLVRHGDRLCAVDLKTAGQRYSESKLASDLQPTVYLYALRIMGHENSFFRWDVLVKTKTPAFEQYSVSRTEHDFHRLVELVRYAEIMINSGLFLPNDGSSFCPGCGYQTACQNWHLSDSPEPAPACQLAHA